MDRFHPRLSASVHTRMYNICRYLFLLHVNVATSPFSIYFLFLTRAHVPNPLHLVASCPVSLNYVQSLPRAHGHNLTNLARPRGILSPPS